MPLERTLPLVRILGEVKKSLDRLVETISEYQQSKPETQAESKVIVGLPVEITEYYRSKQSAPPIQGRRDKLRLGLEVLGVFLALAIAVFTLCSLFIFNGQLREMRRQTEISERPWLSVQIKPQILNFVNGSQAVLGVKISMTNVGKSIAKNIRVSVKLFPTNPSLPIALDAADNQQKLCNPPHPSDAVSFDLFPTDKPAEQVVGVSVLPQAVASQSVKAAYPGQQPRVYVGLYVVG